jgi:MFS family permease
VSEETRPPEKPATFREVFGQSEYRAVYVANVLTSVGDYMTKAAITVLVYQQTSSVALSAASFAVSYLPWLVGGPLLSTLAERRPYRTVMMTCDVVRMCLLLLLAYPGLPVGVMLALVFAITLANPPSQAARSALLPLILTGDRLVVGLSLNITTGQAAQVIGYVAGAGVAIVSPRAALLGNAAAFAISALLIRFGIRYRPPALAKEEGGRLFRETAEGFRLVFGTTVLRAIAVLIFASTLFAIVPEGLAAAWAAERAGSESERGVAQALIMASSPLGFILGGLLIGRLVRPDARRALIRPFAIAAPLTLVPALLDPPPVLVAVLAAACGFAVAGMMPAANALFIQSLPNGFRARAFGVMATGIQVIQGGSVFVTGLLADWLSSVPTVVGVWSLAGAALVAVASTTWPSRDQIEKTVAEVARLNADSADGESTDAAKEPSGRQPSQAGAS